MNVNTDDEFPSFEGDEENVVKLSRKQKTKCYRHNKKYIVAGFKEDAEKIIKEFVSEASLEFSTFGKLWKKNNYALLYMGRESERELCEAAYEMFHVTLNIISDPNSGFTTKVGALYLLYCLYEKQPFPKFKVKIRILSCNFEDIKMIFAVAKETGIFDCVAIILKLLYSHAFHFVHCHFLMGPESSESRNNNEAGAIPVKLWSTEFKEMWDSGMFQNIKNNSDEILKMQQDLGISHLFLNDNSTVDNIMKIGELAAKGDDKIFNLLDEETDKPKPPIDMSIGQRRSKLKERQLYADYTKAASRYLNRKYNEDDDVDHPDLIETDSDLPSNVPKLRDRKLLKEKVNSKETVSCEKSDKSETSTENSEKSGAIRKLRCSGDASDSKKKTSWRKARVIGKSRPEKKISKGKNIKYYESSEDEDI